MSLFPHPCSEGVWLGVGGRGHTQQVPKISNIPWENTFTLCDFCSQILGFFLEPARLKLTGLGRFADSQGQRPWEDSQCSPTGSCLLFTKGQGDAVCTHTAGLPGCPRGGTFQKAGLKRGCAQPRRVEPAARTLVRRDDSLSWGWPVHPRVWNWQSVSTRCQKHPPRQL